MKQEYKDKRKNSILQTKEKRKFQDCKVYELKFDKDKLSKEKINWLNRLFLESKWLYNNILSSKDIFNYNTKIKKVEVLNKDKEKEIRKLNNISSQMKQGIYDRTMGSVKSLSTKKKKGKLNRIGKLKFKSIINSIPLKQFNHTHKFINQKYIKIQGFKKLFKIIGFNQIPENVEFANANLIKKQKNYYLKITCYLSKIERQKTNKNIGLDFGIKTSIIDSEGNKYNFQFSETKSIKNVSKKLHKKKLGSNNRYKQKLKLQKNYEDLKNKKKDIKNKFISRIKKDYDIICIQNEQIHNWAKSKMKGFGKRIQYGIIGGIISELKNYSETVIIDKFFPSTKLCPNCGNKNKLNLNDRIYNCSCGYSKDRDIHSAINILNEGLKQISKGFRNKMPVEKQTSVSEAVALAVSYISVKQEAIVL